MKNLKYAITGHTRGVGKAVYDKVDPDNIIGFSTSTGYDINKREDRDRIVQESFDCDVFINNASDNFGQLYMFLDMLKVWRALPDKKIINIGSRTAEITLPLSHYHLLYVHAEKVALKAVTNQLAPNTKCKVDYRWFPAVGTDAMLAKYPYWTHEDYITPERAADIILSESPLFFTLKLS
jgi:hypothetical protein